MKHKHCDVIKAWADGAEIEVFVKNAWYPAPNPSWSTGHEYRIKPKLIEISSYIFLKGTDWYCDGNSEQPNVRHTFDPDTKQLIKVELI